MSSEDTWNEIAGSLNESGFNLVVRINADEYDSVVPDGKKAGSLLNDARSVILAGFAGNTFWPLFSSYLKENPEFSENDENLIDNYTVLKFKRLVNMLEEGKGVFLKDVYPFGDSAYDLDFTLLGMMGGVGVPSLLGILLHPEYGTWMSLRGAMVTNIEFEDYDKPIQEFNPCPSCEKQCIDACPANTVSTGGWDWESCMKFRMSSDVCADGCASRTACPYGQEHIYSVEQIKYHHDFVLKSMKRYIGTEGK